MSVVSAACAAALGPLEKCLGLQLGVHYAAYMGGQTGLAL